MTAPIQTATTGAPITRAEAAMILLHGRGASAESMLSIAEAFALPDVACLAPQSPGGSWYPYSFLAPIDQNEPFLSRSLATVGKLVADLSAQGFGPERLLLLGFFRADASRWNSRPATHKRTAPSSASAPAS